MTIVEFLTAQLDDLEAEIDITHLTAPLECKIVFHAHVDPTFGWECDCGMPAILRADIAAKRRIIELHSGGHECSQYDHNGDVDNCTYAHDFDDCSTMKLLALPFADRPGYDETWRP